MLIYGLIAALGISLVIIGFMYFNYNPIINLEGASLSELYHPMDIKRNQTHFFVADTQNSRIQVYSSFGGNYILAGTYGFPGTSTTGDELFYPNSMLRNGVELYVSDTFANVVKKFNDNTFEYEFTIGSPGTGDGELYRPGGIVVNGTSLFIADTFNNRISVFNSTTGDFITIFGNSTSP